MWISWARGASLVIWASSITRGSNGVKRGSFQLTSLNPTPPLLTDPRIRAAYAEGAGIYRIVPAGVVVPQGVEELQHLVRWATDTGTPLVPRGAGSGMPGGTVGRGVIVDLSRTFNRLTPDWNRR